MSTKRPREDANAQGLGTGGSGDKSEDGWAVFSETNSRGRTSACLVRTHIESVSSTRIAAFDMDGTLLKVGNGRRHFCQSADDWKPWNSRVKATLAALHEDGFKIVIFSNQAGIQQDHSGPKAAVIKGYCASLLEYVGVPAVAVLAPCYDGCRKPEPGMWSLVARRLNGGVSPDLRRSFFVGDAAGRMGDFAASDREFAQRVGVRFFLPEEAFGGEWEVLDEIARRRGGEAPKGLVANGAN